MTLDPSGAPGTLGAFVRANREEILRRWEARARALPSAAALPAPALRNDVPVILERAADALDGVLPAGIGEAAGSHAEQRASEGYAIEEIVAELAALRDVIFEVRAEAGPITGADALRLSHALDPAVAAAVAHVAATLRGALAAKDEANALLEGLFESAPVGLAFWDRDLRFVRLNERLASMNGLPAAAHLGRTPGELFPGVEGIAEVEAAWRRILDTGEPWIGAEVAGETRARPGERRVWREDFFPVRRGAEVVGVGGVVLDVTAERVLEDRLRLLARASQQLAEAMEDETPLANVARLAVPAFCDWCAVVRRQRGGAIRRVAVHAADPADADLAREVLERFPIDLDAATGIGRVLRADTPELVTSVEDRGGSPAGADLVRRMGIRSYIAAPLRVGGETVGAIVFATSRSGRRLEEADLPFAVELARRCAVYLDNARLLHDARSAARLRERVLAIVSHDLRTPLSTVVQSSDVLLRAAPPGDAGDRVRRTAGAIGRAANRMRRLIDDLLDATAIEAGRLSVKLRPERADAVVREAADAVGAAAGEKGVALRVAASADLPPVRADRDRVLQVLGNLLANALNVTEPGGAVAVSAAAGDREVIFEVRDTGPGIPETEREAIFEPFRRGVGTEYRGTGLGLAIAHGIVAAHGGRMWVESRVGAGSTFAFALPAASPDEAGVDAPAP